MLQTNFWDYMKSQRNMTKEMYDKLTIDEQVEFYAMYIALKANEAKRFIMAVSE